METLKVCTDHQGVGVSVCHVFAFPAEDTGKLQSARAKDIPRLYINGFPSCPFLQAFQLFINFLPPSPNGKRQSADPHTLFLQQTHKAADMVIISMADNRHIQSCDPKTFQAGLQGHLSQFLLTAAPAVDQYAVTACSQ